MEIELDASSVHTEQSTIELHQLVSVPTQGNHSKKKNQWRPVSKTILLHWKSCLSMIKHLVAEWSRRYDN
jgi:hypothetical protein